jgi:hypothetical protein
MPNVYDKLEEAGHDLTMIMGLIAGVSTYMCERCGGLVKVKSGSTVQLFHVPPGNPSTVDKCSQPRPTSSMFPLDEILANVQRQAGRPLLAKLMAIEEAEHELLRRRADGEHDDIGGM